MDIKELISSANNVSNNIIRIQKEHYDTRKAEKGNFNFFSAIVSNDKQHIEKYHSNVIGYFLNPRASHDFDALFLKEFIKILKNKGITDLPDEQEVENIELIREKQTSAGRFIDISLEVGKHWIIFIENKIQSGEQQNQMKDYCCFAKEHYTNRLGIYLTRKGEMPGSIDPKDRDDKLICMPYADIIVWLQSCCKDEAVKTYPHVLSALKQYITVIETLLKTMKEDKKAIREHLLENGNKEKTLNLVRNFGILKDSITELIIEVREKFKKDLEENLTGKNKDYPKIEIDQGDFVWTGDNSNGLGFIIIDKDGKPFNYKGEGYGGRGNGIRIKDLNTGKEINAHYGEGIDQANVILLECYNQEKWNTIVNSAADKIIEEIEDEVLPKYRKNESQPEQ